MRFTRFLTGLLALAVIGFVPVAVAGSAEAATPRTIEVRGVEPRNNVFIIKGKIGTDYAKKKVTLKRQARPGGKYVNVAKIKTNKKGKFQKRVFKASGSPKTCFKVKVKAVGGFDATTSQKLCIIRL